MSGKKAVKSLYSQELTPEVLESRAKQKASYEARVHRITSYNPGRKPEWSSERLQEMDDYCLKEGKRCIMWDDEESGFFLMMNWDWERNRPSVMPNTLEATTEQGWYAVHKQMLRAPLLDKTVPEDKLKDWIHARTMHVHGFLDEQGYPKEGVLRNSPGAGVPGTGS